MLGTKPVADISTPIELVAHLVESQAPHLCELPLREFSSGWDNAMFRLGEEYLVRLPRRRVAAALIEYEHRWLPEIDDRVDVCVPSPIVFGEPSVRFPFHFSIVPFFPGTTLATFLASQGASKTTTLSGLSKDLSLFFSQLHRPEEGHFPLNPYRGVPLRERRDTFASRLEAARLVGVEDAGLLEMFDSAAQTTWAGPPVWLHGDPHSQNLIVDDSGRLVAVIDFGDMTCGDPASDLAVAFSLFRGSSRQAFIDSTGYDSMTFERARAWALYYGLAFLDASSDNPTMFEIGEANLLGALEQ